MKVAIKTKTTSGQFDIVPLSKYIGAEIRGIDLREKPGPGISTE